MGDKFEKALKKSRNEIGFDCVGTIRRNRFSGCELMDEKEMKRFCMGHVDWRVEKSTEVCLVCWYDNKAVTLVSNYVALEPKDTGRRWDSFEKKYVEIQRPAVIKEYNKYMGGEDLADMLFELYH
ncbi:piggyBac transposable element-derived protein 3-like [Artemia franciscana]|uniref:piggyBac transposable element-derived protein 3-like n=1 Tax=Artemia franciscana TaxID=6661 RepID=UPI0032D9B083